MHVQTAQLMSNNPNKHSTCYWSVDTIGRKVVFLLPKSLQNTCLPQNCKYFNLWPMVIRHNAEFKRKWPLLQSLCIYCSLLYPGSFIQALWALTGHNRDIQPLKHRNWPSLPLIQFTVYIWYSGINISILTSVSDTSMHLTFQVSQAIK